MSAGHDGGSYIGTALYALGIQNAKVHALTFDELLNKACLTKRGRIQLPSALSDETKKTVLQLSLEGAGARVICGNRRDKSWNS